MQSARVAAAAGQRFAAPAAPTYSAAPQSAGFSNATSMPGSFAASGLLTESAAGA